MRDGELIYAPDLDAANQSIELIARLSGLWIERREVTVRNLSGHNAEVVPLSVIEGGNHTKPA